MLFSEVYSAYFNAISDIISFVLLNDEKAVSEKDIYEIIQRRAFSESIPTILSAIKSEEWLVLTKDFRTPIKNQPEMPLTLLEKRWLKSLLSDPRIQLFDVDPTGLEDVDVLFDFDDFVFFDQHTDGDPYTDEKYQNIFKTIFTALKEKRRLSITYANRYNKIITVKCIPYRLEYSSKNDKFRLETSGGNYAAYFNLSRIRKCELLEEYPNKKMFPPKRKEYYVSFRLKDERKALDRVMQNFSDCRKETTFLENNFYQVKLWYEAQDETEILIRILSFGPMLKVDEPMYFISLIQERLKKQIALNEEVATHRK